MDDVTYKMKPCTCTPRPSLTRLCRPLRPIVVCDHGNKCDGRPIWVVERVTHNGIPKLSIVVFVGPKDPRNRILTFDGDVISRDETLIRRLFAGQLGLDDAHLDHYFDGVDLSNVLDG